MGNSILAQSAGNACGGTITSAGYNVDTGTSCGFGAANHDLSNTNPQLGPLQDNGGGTLTRAIAFSSPAVDSANSAAGVCPQTDQRGVARPQPPSSPPQSNCDRGAYEVVGYTNANALDIGPGQCVNSTLTINEKFAIGRLLAGVNLTYHTGSRTNLTIRLFSPGLPKVTLLGPAANSGQNLDTMFDDSASSVVPARASKSRFSVLRQHLQAVHAAVASSRHRHSGNLEAGNLQCGNCEGDTQSLGVGCARNFGLQSLPARYPAQLTVWTGATRVSGVPVAPVQ